MNPGMETAITGFPRTNSSIGPQCWRTRAEPGFSTTIPRASTEPVWGTQFAAACNPETLTEFSIGLWKSPGEIAEEVWGSPEGYGLAMSGQYLDLTGAPFIGQAQLGYGIVSGLILPREPHELVFEYTLQVPAATGLSVNATASYVNATLPTLESPLAVHQETNGALTSAIQRAFASGELVEFEDGVENEFTKQLTRLVKTWGELGIRRLANLIFRPGFRTEIAAQTLLCFGRIGDEGSYAARARTFRQALLSSSAKVRDAAAVGIASILDVGAISDLAKAIEKETLPSLKDDMRDILTYLKTLK